MNLAAETIIVTLAMALLCALPLVSSRVRAKSVFFVLMGTGAMFGICLFDLLPDVYEMGGKAGLLATAVIWLVYSFLHVFHLDRHHIQTYEGTLITPSPFFFCAIIGHCFASGMLLSISRSYAPNLSVNIYAALVIHKAYEALTVSSILVGNRSPWKSKTAIIVAYSLSFPAGVIAVLALGARISQPIVLAISSLAVGTLLGCLVFDFIFPSLSRLRRRWAEAGWVALGFLFSQVVMRFFSA